MPRGYPPSHRSTDEPQPEVCQLCGLLVGGARLREAYTEGLRGMRICDVQEGCRNFRQNLSVRDRFEIVPDPELLYTRTRIYEPGAKPWWEGEEEE